MLTILLFPTPVSPKTMTFGINCWRIRRGWLRTIGRKRLAHYLGHGESCVKACSSCRRWEGIHIGTSMASCLKRVQSGSFRTYGTRSVTIFEFLWWTRLVACHIWRYLWCTKTCPPRAAVGNSLDRTQGFLCAPHAWPYIFSNFSYELKGRLPWGGDTALEQNDGSLRGVEGTVRGFRLRKRLNSGFYYL